MENTRISVIWNKMKFFYFYKMLNPLQFLLEEKNVLPKNDV